MRIKRKGRAKKKDSTFGYAGARPKKKQDAGMGKRTSMRLGNERSKRHAGKRTIKAETIKADSGALPGRMPPERRKAAEQKAAAFFDIDKTVVSVNTGRMYVMHLFLKGIISPLAAIRINWQMGRYFFNSVDYGEGMRKAYSVTKGWVVQDVIKVLDAYYRKKVRWTIYRDMKRLIEEHRKKGRLIVFISNSWEPMVRNIAEELKPDYLFATRVGEENGKYNGVIERVCFGRHKRKYIMELAADKGISLKGCYAYSDHISDIPMLEAVGHPVAVNPDSSLKKAAHERGWGILYPK